MWKRTDCLPHQVFSCYLAVNTVYVLVIFISSEHVCISIFFFFENEMIPFTLHQKFFKENLKICLRVYKICSPNILRGESSSGV